MDTFHPPRNAPGSTVPPRPAPVTTALVDWEPLNGMSRKDFAGWLADTRGLLDSTEQRVVTDHGVRLEAIRMVHGSDHPVHQTGVAAFEHDLDVLRQVRDAVEACAAHGTVPVVRIATRRQVRISAAIRWGLGPAMIWAAEHLGVIDLGLFAPVAMLLSVLATAMLSAGPPTVPIPGVDRVLTAQVTSARPRTTTLAAIAGAVVGVLLAMVVRALVELAVAIATGAAIALWQAIILPALILIGVVVGLWLHWAWDRPFHPWWD